MGFTNPVSRQRMPIEAWNQHDCLDRRLQRLSQQTCENSDLVIVRASETQHVSTPAILIIAIVRVVRACFQKVTSITRITQIGPVSQGS